MTTTAARVRILTRLVDEAEFELKELMPAGYTRVEYEQLLDIADCLELEGRVHVFYVATDPDCNAVTVVITRPNHRPLGDYGKGAA